MSIRDGSAQVDWKKDERRCHQLRTLWASGTPTRQIAAQMRMTKSAICGAARRLGLPPRGNFAGASREKRKELHERFLQGAPVSERTALRIYPDKPPAPAGRRSDRAMLAAAKRAPTEPRPERPAPILLPSLGVFGPVRKCCWPTWETKGPGYWERICEGRAMQCDAPTIPGKPYCPEHCSLGFKSVRDRSGTYHPVVDGVGSAD